MRTSYDTDFAAWAREQAAALREGRVDTLDRDHLAEEIEGLVRSDKRALASQVERILLHLLKWHHQPALRSVSWRRSIALGRHAVADLIEDSRSLANELPVLLPKAYTRARAGAIVETGLPAATFPKTCPYTLPAILEDAGLGEGEES